jgi:hypothetical protein
MGADDMEAASPAPEGEVVTWREDDGGKWVYYDAASDTGQHIRDYQKERHGVDVFPLYASPVVPVGVSEEQRQRVAEIVEDAIERHAPANSIRHTLDDADAIMAALRPTDTGANHD